MKYLIGIDLGTSGVKSVLSDGSEIIASHTVEYPVYQPQNGYAEQSPAEWWNAAVETVKKITENIDKSKIAGIGLSGQMQGLVMLDDNNRIIRPCIIWCDQRTGAECEEMERLLSRETILHYTFNPALTGFTASKILWVRNNEPENYKRCKHILLPKDYIGFMLTGEYATDLSDASATQLLDIKNRIWSDEIIKGLDIDPAILPKLHESADIAGYVTDRASKETGLPAGIPVAAGGGDNACAALGTGTVYEGKAFVTIGTSGVVFAHSDTPKYDPEGRTHTQCCAVPGKWHIMGATQAAGLSLKWFRENFCPQLSYSEMDSLAEEMEIGADRCIYLPYLMGERTPHLDPDARGLFFGLSAAHGKGNMIRAVMEGVAFSLRQSVDILRAAGVKIEDMVACGGGGASKLWREIMADNFNCNVKTQMSNQAAAIGAVILAGACSKVFSSVEDGCKAMVKEKDSISPNKENKEKYDRYYEIYKDLYIRLKDSYKDLAALK